MSPRNKIENEQVRQESRTKILDAALKLFGNKGYSATSIATIAKEAGISKGLMYNYFVSKEELLMAIIAHVIEETETLYAEVYAEKDPKILFEKMVDLTVSFLQTEREFNALLVSIAIQKETHQSIRKVSEDKIKQMMPFLQNVLAQLGFEDEYEVYLVGAAFDGMAIQYLSYEDEDFLNKTAKALKRKYLKSSAF